MRAVFVALILALGPSLVHPSAAAAQASPLTARLTVFVLDEEAEIRVDGALVQGFGGRRTLTVPLKGSGQATNVEVSWHPNAYTKLYRPKSIVLSPGETAELDFTEETPADRAEIIYVPTPANVATRMAEMAGVTPDDIVFELGSGDGRTLITAVRYGGARHGVGVEIDPKLADRSRANAEAAGLADRIEIRTGDAFDDKVTAGLDQATVVLLYMGDEFDLLIRPKLLKNLKPGARIVSHRFGMGDWAPDKTETMADYEDQYTLHMWVVKESDKNRDSGR